MLKIGIVGLPNVGKSTLFNALLKKQVAQSANYPFTTIDPNVGVVEVPDFRLEKLAKVVSTEKIIAATVEFVDIAGLVKDAHKGEGLGNRFLSHIREVDAIAHVVRAFEDPDVVRSGLDPKSDVETINIELMLADLETVNKLIDGKEREAKISKEAKEEVLVLEKIKDGLEEETFSKDVAVSEKFAEFAKKLPLITNKPVIYVFNVAEEDLKDSEKLAKFPEESSPSVYLCAKIEAELSALSEEEQKEYLKDLGEKKSGLEKLIQASYELLGLITFFTAGEKEVRGWTIPDRTKAPQAAGTIHTDFERGFIKAEVINWEKLVEAGGWQKAREKGLVRMEGKDYVFQDGDGALFKFNV
ncbi:MAG: redox-regulated ATPase YchF [Candidatus Woykebacteria bacterium]